MADSQILLGIETIRPYLTHALAMLFSGFVTYLFTTSHYRKQKWHEFDERRLDELYGPLLGLITQVRANCINRLSIVRASDEAWREICARHEGAPFLDSDKFFQPFEKEMEYENERFRKEDLTAYDKMLQIFRGNIHLAYPSTKKWFDEFSRYVDHWHRPWPREVLIKMNISEEPLLEFYKDVERQTEQLRRRLSGK